MASRFAYVSYPYRHVADQDAASPAHHSVIVAGGGLVGLTFAVDMALAGHDVLYSEGAAYAARLKEESNAVVRCWPGQIHGFLSMSGLIPEAVEAANWLCGAWRDIAA